MNTPYSLNGASEAYDALEDLYKDREDLNTEIFRELQKAEDNIVEELYKLQEDVSSNETYTLMHSTETGRGGTYSFDETLTSEGVEARNVSRNGEPGHDSSEMYLWPGNWDSQDEPLDIESEYLIGDRNSSKFVRKLYERLDSGEVPEMSFFYD